MAEVSRSVFRSALLCLLAPVFFTTMAARAEVTDDQVITFVTAERLEYRAQEGDDLLYWDLQGWAGTDRNKLAFKSEGEKPANGATEGAELQLLYKRLISNYFDAQVGVRYDFRPDPSRGYGVVGVQGLAPYWFEVDANIFLSDEGDLSARLEVDYDLLFTQRLIFQPRLELNVAFSDDSEIGVGAGFSDLELGLRLRYEIVREIAPYAGLHWERKFGNSADFARDEGEDIDSIFVVAGMRLWF